MKIRRWRKQQKVRSKPTDQEKLVLLEHNKQLQSKKAQKEREAIYLRIFGGVLLAGLIYTWYGRNPSIPMSSWMLMSGIIVAVIFKVLIRASIVSEKSIQRLLGYFMIVDIVLLVVNRTAFGLATLFLFSLLPTTLLLGVMKSFPASKPQSLIDSEGG